MELSDELVDGFLDETDVPNKRSTFLTVLCILSFVGNGLSIIQGLVSWAMFGFISSVSNSFSKNPSQKNEVSNLFNSMSIMSISMIIGSILCIVGVIFMFRLKRKGFFFYLFGQILPILAVFYFTLSLPGGNTLGISLLITIASAVIPVVFIILYAINLNQLK